jgi:hypothetical protein
VVHDQFPEPARPVGSGVADDYGSLGYIHHHLHDMAQSFADYRSISLWRELGADYDEAVTLIRLGDAQEADGDTAAAVTTWRQALEILVRLDHQDAAPLRARLAAIS